MFAKTLMFYSGYNPRLCFICNTVLLTYRVINILHKSDYFNTLYVDTVSFALSHSPLRLPRPLTFVLRSFTVLVLFISFCLLFHCILVSRLNQR